MNRVFKTTSRRAPRSLASYERDFLEEILVGLVIPEDEEQTAESILAEARREAEQKVREAYAEGMRKGFEAGKAQFDESVAGASQALSAAAETVADARLEFIESLTPQVLELATAIAARIVQREVDVDGELVLRTAQRALGHLANQERVTVRVHPDDLETVKARRVELLERIEGVEQLAVIADESVGRGGCTVSSVFMEADARLESQLETILAVLRDSNGGS